MRLLEKDCLKPQLKKVIERNRGTWVSGAIAVLLKAKAVVNPHENSKSRLEILRFSGKASASPCQRRDIMAQVSVDTFQCEGVVFAVGVVNVLSWKHNIQSYPSM